MKNIKLPNVRNKHATTRKWYQELPEAPSPAVHAGSRARWGLGGAGTKNKK